MLAVREREILMSTTPDETQPQPQAQVPPQPEQPAGAPEQPYAAQAPVEQSSAAPALATPPLAAPADPAAVFGGNATQETTPLPAESLAHATAGHASESHAHESWQQAPQGFSGGGATPPPSAPTQQSQHRYGGWIAGAAIGALVGGLIGGGTAAVVAHNMDGKTTVQAEKSQSGSLTLNNLDSATAITGVAAVATPSVVTLQVSGSQEAGTGSGVIYSEDGYIITNAHVATLEGATANPDIQVQLSDGTLYAGKLVGSDPFSDLAVVKIDATGLTPIKMANSDKINVGDLAVAIGAPLNLSNTVTSGVVSALNRGISVASSMVPDQQKQDSGQQNQQGSPFPWFEFQNPNGDEQQQQQVPSSGARVAIPVIQTDASINPGNSGGALLNANGELIGINVALASAGGDSGAAGSDGLGFAVPSNLAVRVADSLIKGEKPSHGLLGVTQTSDSSANNEAGGVIGEVTKGSPADKAGLRPGDVITSVNGVRTDSFTTVTALVRMQAGGSQVTIGFNRDGKQMEADVTLGTLEW